MSAFFLIMCYTEVTLYSALMLSVDGLLQAAQYTETMLGRNPGIEKETCHLLIKHCIVAIAIQNLFSAPVSKSFMPAEA